MLPSMRTGPSACGLRGAQRATAPISRDREAVVWYRATAVRRPDRGALDCRDATDRAPLMATIVHPRSNESLQQTGVAGAWW